MYNDPNCKPWTSRAWAPPGYASRFDLIEQTKADQASKTLESGTLYEKQIVEHAEMHGDDQQPTNGNSPGNGGIDAGALRGGKTDDVTDAENGTGNGAVDRGAGAGAAIPKMTDPGTTGDVPLGYTT